MCSSDLEMEDNSDSMILGRPFLATAGALIDVKGGKLKLQFGSEQAEFSMKHASHLPHTLEQCHAVDIIEKSVMESLTELELQEPKVQVFVTADNTKPQELCGITLFRDAFDKVESK